MNKEKDNHQDVVLNVKIINSTPTTAEDHENWKNEDFARITDCVEVTRAGGVDGKYTKGR